MIASQYLQQHIWENTQVYIYYWLYKPHRNCTKSVQLPTHCFCRECKKLPTLTVPYCPALPLTQLLNTDWRRLGYVLSRIHEFSFLYFFIFAAFFLFRGEYYDTPICCLVDFQSNTCDFSSNIVPKSFICYLFYCFPFCSILAGSWKVRNLYPEHSLGRELYDWEGLFLYVYECVYECGCGCGEVDGFPVFFFFFFAVVRFAKRGILQYIDFITEVNKKQDEHGIFLK